MLNQSTITTLFVRALLSVIFLSGYGIVLWIVLQPGAEFSETATTILNFLLGALTTSIVGIVNYWFSNTQGSVEKTSALIANASKTS